VTEGFRRQADRLLHIDKVPGDELDYGVEWADWIPSNGSIVTRGFTVPTGLTQQTNGQVGTQTVVRLAGGTAGTSYSVTAWVVLSTGERVERTFVVDVVARLS